MSTSKNEMSSDIHNEFSAYYSKSKVKVEDLEIKNKTTGKCIKCEDVTIEKIWYNI